MTQLAETLLSNTPPIAWPQLFTSHHSQPSAQNSAQPNANNSAQNSTQPSAQHNAKNSAQQSLAIKQVTYGQGQFNISAQERQVMTNSNSHYLTLIGATLASDALVNLLSALSALQVSVQTRDAEIIIYPPATYPLTLDALTVNATPLTTTDIGTATRGVRGNVGDSGDIVVLGFPELSTALRQQFNATLTTWSHAHQVDYAFSQTLPSLSQPGVVLMDMDSTTIQIECIDEIAKLAGVGEQVAAVTTKAMNGELDFTASLRSRVATLTNCPEAVLSQVADAMPLMPGLALLITTLHQANWKVAIASGGFSYFAERLQADLGFDAVYANDLEIVDGRLTGKVIGAIVDAQVKADTLLALASQYQLAPQQTVAIGDGANDLMMLKSAALGVAIHAKPIVQQQAPVALNHHDLEGLVGLLQAASCVQANWS